MQNDALALPQAPGSEASILGSLLKEPAEFPGVFEKVVPTDFYHTPHRLVYEGMALAFEENGTFDLPILNDEMTNRGTLEKVGGASFLNELLGHASGAHLPHHILQVKKRAQERSVLAGVSEVRYVITDPERNGQDVLTIAKGILLKTAEKVEVEEKAPQWLKPSYLAEFDTSNDPTSLMGRRFLCNGGGLAVIGSTGIGKSVEAVQFSIHAALGLEYFGMKFARPLRVVQLTAEDDKGDLAEMVQGVVAGLGLQDRMEELDENLLILDERGRTGDRFLARGEEILKAERPDIMGVNPLFAFLGGDASDQACMSAFLRDGLNSLAQKYGCAFKVTHHPPKPLRSGDAYKLRDAAYSGHGSAELANWARAVLVLQGLGEGRFKLVAAKRGARAGFTDNAGNETLEVSLKHDVGRLCWLRDSENHEAEADAQMLTDMQAEFEPGKIYEAADLRKVVCKYLGVKTNSVYQKGRRAHRAYQTLMAAGVHSGKGYIFGDVT